MTMFTFSWSIERRYGNASLRLLMLTLAMDTGGEAEMSHSMERLAHKTEIDVDDLPGLLDAAVAGGHLIKWRHEPPSFTGSDFSVVFPASAFKPYVPGPIVKVPHCPPNLRWRVIAGFKSVCSYCRRQGDERNGPDGSAWQIDRIVAGGAYAANNVTLSCRPCNAGKSNRPAPEGTRSLAEIEALL